MLRDHVAFYAWPFDGCFIDDERVIPQAGKTADRKPTVIRVFQEDDMLTHRTIGTFNITRCPGALKVRDKDHFNNWGTKYFPDMPTALQWAHLAKLHKSKPEFHSRPPLSLAA